jgi:hypothetical protein
MFGIPNFLKKAEKWLRVAVLRVFAGFCAFSGLFF